MSNEVLLTEFTDEELAAELKRREMAAADEAPITFYATAQLVVEFDGPAGAGEVTRVRILPPLDEKGFRVDSVDQERASAGRLQEAIHFLSTCTWAPLLDLPDTVVWES